MADDVNALAALFGSGGSYAKGPYDLGQFENTLGRNDLWKLAAAPVMGARFDTSRWSPGTTFGVTAGQAFVGSLLNAMGQRSEGEQMAKVAQVLPQLYKDPSSVAVPEGVDPEAFGGLKLSALKDQSVRSQLDFDAKTKLFADVFSKNPAIALQTMPEMADKFGVKVPQASEPSVPPPPANPLASGRDSTADKIIDYTQRFMAGGMSQAQAAIAARQQVTGEIAANNKTFDEAKSAREYGQKLLDLASTAKAGMSEAGTTGPYNRAASAYEAIANMFGSPEAAKNLRGDAVLSSIAPELIKLSRSPGAVSDFESKLYLGSGPNVYQTPETNAVLAQKMEDLGKLNLDYADFLEAYREANAGSTVGAASKWAEYRKAFPIFNGTGDQISLNTNRPSWQEYFMGVGAAAAPDTSNSQAMHTENAPHTADREAALEELRKRGKL